MRKKISKLLVTGGAGFIGSEFVRQGIKRGYKIIVVDKLTYAGDLARLEAFKGRFNFYKTDISNKQGIELIFRKEKPKIIVNFAAESHVDRSIYEASLFTETNIKGTQILLDSSRKYKISKFVHISSDEVYGDIISGKFSEKAPLNPSSPYSASKAAADCFIKAYVRTYGFPAVIVRPSNNYGPWQYPEKFIPVVIYKALKNDKIPIYARGLNKREWLHVSDCARAIFLALEKGRTGEIYNVGSGAERKNIETAKKIIKILGKPGKLIKFVKDRPGHDYRYSLHSLKIKKLGFKPKVDFEKGLLDTVNWYLANQRWLNDKINEQSKG